MGKAICPPLR